ncbi:S-adenosyl-L-methionine-dependent methyltransferase [Phyllosticta citricarpa]|uniref:DNA (cytosine-5-)-methyltransferase n=2 Tax=Phyllosticta TaxID=121621 RepID=A0ABR1MHE8_9PEZI
MSSVAGSSANNPIELRDDPIGEVLVIDIDDSGTYDDDELEIISPIVPKKRPIQLRNQPPQHPWILIETHNVDHKREELGPRGSRIAVGDTVEVKHDGHINSFLRVFHILENVVSGKVRLRGLLLKRNQSIAPLLNLKLNEVFLHVRTYTSSIDSRPYAEQGLEEFGVENFIRKRTLTFTNKSIKELSWRNDVKLDIRAQNYTKCKQEIRDGELLCCRYAFIQTFAHKMDKDLSTSRCQNELRPLTLDEADDRGGTLRGPQPPAEPSTAPKTPVSPLKRKRGQEVDHPYDEGMERHTFGDVFCGAGGASCGARMAGLEISFGVDNDKDALNSYAQNFPNAQRFAMDAQDFATRLPDEEVPHVDILHMSPPCQFFSQAHTTEGRNDEKNFAAIFTIGQLVEKVQPRIVTLEETNGILRSTHVKTFYQALSQIVSLGYGLRWAVLPCQGYGCAQPRKRLFLLASAPGVPLPPFPKPTHGPPGPELRESGLRPFTTLRLAVTNIASNSTLHDPENEKRRFDSPKEPFDPDECSKRTMLTNNEGNFYHWSGLRKWTPREMACLQGFPTTHQFTGQLGEIRRQIGNAVPPNVMQLFHRECVEILKRIDDYKAARPRPESPAVNLAEEEDGDVVIQSVETSQDQEVRAATLPPLPWLRDASLGMQPRDDESVTIGPEEIGSVLVDGGHDSDATVELADQDDSSDDAPVPRAFFVDASSSEGSVFGSVIIDSEGSFTAPSIASSREENEKENKGGDLDCGVINKDENTDAKPLPEGRSESLSPDPTVAARGMMRRMSLQPLGVDDGGEAGQSRQVRNEERVVIVIDDD